MGPKGVWMSDDQSLDRATLRFLYHLSTQNGRWKQNDTGHVNIDAKGAEGIRHSGAPFDDERARQVAESWGFEIVDKVKISSRYYWRARRADAPAADIIGGPRRDLVRANSKAQA